MVFIFSGTNGWLEASPLHNREASVYFRLQGSQLFTRFKKGSGDILEGIGQRSPENNDDDTPVAVPTTGKIANLRIILF